MQNHGHEKAFDLVRAKDPQTEIIIGARTDALEDPELTDGARVLFCRLLDLALDPSKNNNRRGEIIISTTQLSERLKRSGRAIYGWKKELVDKRFVWITKVPRPNMHAIHKFHITALQPRKELQEDIPGDGLWGNGYRRPEQIMPLGARARLTGTKRHLGGGGVSGLCDQFGKPVSSVLLENATATRTERHLPPASFAGGSGKFCHSHPQVLRERPAQNDTSPPQVLRVAAAKLAGETGTNRQSLGESQYEKETFLEGGGGTEAPPADALEVKFKKWELRLDDFRNSDLRNMEQLLVKELRASITPKFGDFIKRKLAAVRLRLRGPSLVEPVTTATATAKPALAKVNPLPFGEMKARFAAARKEAGV